MNIAFIGKTNLNNGPANVNNDYKKHLQDRVYFLKHNDFLLRILEIIKTVNNSDALIISSLCITNDFAVRYATLKKKPFVYLMHGCYDYETDINKEKYSKYFHNVEQRVLTNAVKIVAVSEMYMKWVKEYFPEFANKVTFVNNGIDWSYYKYSKNTKKDPYLILTTGGGGPIKRNIPICKAIESLNTQYKLPFKLVVLGRDSAETDTIKSFKHTNYVGQVSREETTKWQQKASIYISNSEVESFGLAPVEALSQGCDILISKNIGAISIMSNIKDDDIIFNNLNENEIASKILKLKQEGNNHRVFFGIDQEKSSTEYASSRLLDIVTKLIQR